MGFDNLIASTPLAKALFRIFVEFNDHKKILSLTFFLNLSGSNVAYAYENFSKTVKMPWDSPMGPSVITRLFQRIN